MAYLSNVQLNEIQETLTTLYYKKKFISEGQRKRFLGLLPETLKQEDLQHFRQTLEILGDWSQKQSIVDELFKHWELESKRMSETRHSSNIRTISRLEHWYNQKKRKVVGCETLRFSYQEVVFHENVPFDNISLYPQFLIHLASSN